MQRIFKQKSTGEDGLVGWIWGGTFLVIALVVSFGDAMFIKLMWGYFPDGFLRYLAVGGACTTALSIILLVLGKERWFRPGKQLEFAYGFTGAEVLVSIFNVLCASGVSMVFWWMPLSPATPFVSLVGWIVIRMLDQSTKNRHADMKMEDEILKSEREFRKSQHEAEMLIRQKALEYNTQYMINALEEQGHQKTIAEAANKLTGRTIQEVLGITVPSQANGQKQLAPVSLPQTAQIPEKTVTLTQTQFDELVKQKPDPS
jgi:hypothetical protein